MPIYEFEGKRPVIAPDAYVYPEATIIGDVQIGSGCYIAPGARLRGDWGAIVVGPRSNIQENCIIHSAPGVITILGAKSHIGHGAILHDAVLEEHVVVGMGAIIMQGVKIGAGSCIAAGALVTSGIVVGPRRLLVGVPAVDIGEVTDAFSASLETGTGYYMALPPRLFKGLREISLHEVVRKC
ncbi:MAG TPA: gamma carbonic anhydrase family protein [Desulfotomaculum sp.]|nr:MAG: carbonic anhydrase [Desulfotomaculum sp. BICA1-6]HBX22095.1 gamma carbonic anhydrase family protein [Desulfotomaculum sp.]